MKLNIDDLSITFEGKLILKNIQLQVQEGEFVTIIGPSGCGKSTLLNILTGTLIAHRGKVFVDGHPLHGNSSHFAYMPQNDLLLPWLTILDNVCLYGKLHHEKKKYYMKARQLLQEFGLSGYENAYPHMLSGGMRQRAAFLRTALCQADILLLDEPFAALDIITRYDMQDWLLHMRTKLHKTTLLVTHDIDEAIYLSDRIIVLSDKPACIRKEIILQTTDRNRDWLYEQTILRKEIYHYLKEDPHVV